GATRAHAGFEGFVIRGASATDLAPIRDIVYTVLSEYGLAPDPSGTDADLADIEANYFAPGGRFEVAVGADGRIAGCCGLVPRDADAGELRKMYLRKDVRGFGIGGRLLRRALAFARNRGYQRIELETAAVLKEAIALYRGAGFKPIERKHLARRCDQAYGLEL
ncbi:MAG TPA: GNAT family N-acetyltransferase, partial [Usitatibacter sp.]|nr:GNAT family N-acetyltransferase [Usitatibacter sp.]